MKIHHHTARLGRAAVLAGLALVASGLTPATAATPAAPAPAPAPASVAHVITSLPVEIQRPGSYVVAGNLDLATNGVGITITANDVVLDLGGHTLEGLASGRAGILITSGVQNVRIRNGAILGWGNAVHASFATDCRLSDLSTSDTLGTGFIVGDRFVVERCTAIDCTLNGIIVGSNSIVVDCTVTGAGLPGIVCAVPDLSDLGDGTSFIRCVSNANAGGIFAGFDTRCVDCSTSFNAPGFGISVTAGSVVTGCTSRLNDGDGIVIEPCNYAATCSEGAVIEDCVASGNTGSGINAMTLGSRVVGCVANENLERGIVVFAGSSVQASIASGNGSHGFLLPVGQPGSAVLDCLAERNGASSGGTGDGINAQAPCSIRGCTVIDSTNVGIYIGTGAAAEGVVSVVADCTVHASSGFGTGDGIFVFEGVSMERCTVSGHQVDGIDVGSASVVSHCTVTDCGVRGIFVLENGVVENTTTNANGADGLWCGPRSILTNCTARQNGGDGIVADLLSLVRNCHATRNDTGIFTGGGVVLQQCSGNENIGVGILTGNHSKLTECTANSNGTNGIQAGAYSDIRACTARINTTTGHAAIYADGFCAVRDCRVSRSFVGIYAPNGFVTGCLSELNIDSNYLGATFLGPVSDINFSTPLGAWSNQE
ncbi:hypothetical protein Pla163_33360 [Planctomycetes bacterium Pla163]|uniref:Right handed beta helix domain-containing protein n=1 Tax=Rohdeia mirabilis TaxID=2528008 RepID=A0A518D3Y6_9BACT|nr:hypothetical protein Pla163_33360 [Planctomycetes bacterium Pla163]